MKEYKEGDTVYVKGKVNYIDNTALPYCVDFVSSSSIGWITGNDIIDELPTTEPVKPVLPKDVANEMLKAKEKNEFFDLYIQRVIGATPWYPHSNKYWYSNDGNNTEILLNAWNNGYTVETEKKYNVKVPHTKDVWYYKADKVYLQTICPAGDKFLRGKFTEAEIEHYGLQDCEKEEVKQ